MIEIAYDSFRVHSGTELFAAVSHTRIVTGYFKRQNIKRALDEMYIYNPLWETKLANVFIVCQR